MRMYAIIRSGSRQFRVAPGETVEVGRLDAHEGDEITFDQVLLVGGDSPRLSPADLKGASVSAKVLGHARGRKTIGLKYKPKKHYRRRVGNRTQLTRVQITGITLPGAKES
jgi:large subunit ribosomal protein L21